MKKISRKEAAATGLQTYFTGRPCNRGHLDERLVSNWSCKSCMSVYRLENRKAIEIWTDDYRSRNRKKEVARRKQYYLDNRDRELELSKQYHINNYIPRIEL